MKAKDKDYIECLHYFIHKKLFYVLLTLLILLPLLILGGESFKIVEYYIHKKDPYTFRYDDFRLLKYEGKVEILDDYNQIIYRGSFSKGHCNGKGILYHQGKKYYEGNFEEGVMQDEQGKIFYENGALNYEGSIIKNKKEKEGIQYYENGKKKEEGTFLNNTLEGEGITYDKQGLLSYKGTFKKGKYHGVGTLFNKDESVRYEGAFLNGEKHGEGKLYSEYGKLLYIGAMIHDQIDFSAYVNTTLDVIQTHFIETPYLIISNKKSAFAFLGLDLIFVSNANIGFTQSMLKDVDGKDLISIIEMDDKTKKENILCHEVILVHQAYNLWDESNFEQKNIQEKLRSLKGNPFQNKRRQNEEDAFVKVFLKIKENMEVEEITYKKYSQWIYQIDSFKDIIILEEMYKRFDENQIYTFENQRFVYSMLVYAHQKAK